MLEASDPASHGFAFAEPLILLLASVAGVAISRRLGLGSVLGYLAAGVVIGPVAQLITDAERDHAGRRTRHRDVPVPDRAGAEAGAALVDARGHFRPRSGAGRADRNDPCRDLLHGRLADRSGHHCRLRPCHVVDGVRHAGADRARRADNALRPEGDRHPLVPGSRCRAAPRGGAARRARRRALRRWRAVGDREGGGGARRAPPRGTLPAEPVVPPARPHPGARGDDGGRAARRAGRGGADGFRRAVDGDGRVPRRTDARQLCLPARARG